MSNEYGPFDGAVVVNFKMVQTAEREAQVNLHWLRGEWCVSGACEPDLTYLATLMLRISCGIFNITDMAFPSPWCSSLLSARVVPWRRGSPGSRFPSPWCSSLLSARV